MENPVDVKVSFGVKLSLDTEPSVDETLSFGVKLPLGVKVSPVKVSRGSFA